jgi:hypothetical protein
MALHAKDIPLDTHDSVQRAIKNVDKGSALPSARKYTTSANMTTAADITNAPTVATQKIRVHEVWVSTDTNMSFTLQEETSATVFFKFWLSANIPFIFMPRSQFILDTVNKKLQGKASVAGNIDVTVFFTSE